MGLADALLMTAPFQRPDHSNHPADAREPSDEVVRLATLSHELANLLDGSSRCLCIARQDLRGGILEAGSLEAVGRRLETVAGALERMASLVDGAMRDANRGVTQFGGPISRIAIADSIRHAIEVSKPIGAPARISIDAEIDPSIGSTPTGPLYTPILNAIRNGIEAIERSGGPGRVLVSGTVDASDRVPVIRIRVSDTGPGLSPGFCALSAQPSPGGTGIGLALSTTIVRSLGGDVRLFNGADGGAVFELTCPLASLDRDREGASS